MKGPVLAAILALGVVMGCSQNDGAAATAVQSPEVATATNHAVDIDQDPQVSTDQDSTVVPSVGRGFVPLDNPSSLAVHEAGYLGDDELVLGVEWAGEVRAYPLRLIRYHHIVNDIVDGEPLLVTY